MPKHTLSNSEVVGVLEKRGIPHVTAVDIYLELKPLLDRTELLGRQDEVLRAIHGALKQDNAKYFKDRLKQLKSELEGKK